MRHFEKCRLYSQSESGYILATTLIFLLVLSLLILSAGENSILETKMSDYDQAKFITETAAESQLIANELLLMGQKYSPPDSDALVESEIKFQNKDNCQRSNYLIDVMATYQQAEYHLQSLFQVKPANIPLDCIDQLMLNHRIWWQ
jgi:hypothetical protein